MKKKKDNEYGSNVNLTDNMGKNEDREMEPEDKGKDKGMSKDKDPEGHINPE